MSGNTLAHAGQNLPASESENENVINFFDGYKSFPFWQAHAVNAAAYVRDLKELVEQAHFQGESDFADSILSLVNELTQTASEFQGRANAAREFSAQNLGSQSDNIPTCTVTSRGQRLLDLLTYDIAYLTTGDLGTLLGVAELDHTLQELRECRDGNSKNIRPITIQRGLIACAAPQDTNGGAA